MAGAEPIHPIFNGDRPLFSGMGFISPKQGSVPDLFLFRGMGFISPKQGSVPDLRFVPAVDARFFLVPIIIIQKK